MARPGQPSVMDRILAMLKHGPLTPAQIRARIGASWSYGNALLRLRRDGRIVREGEVYRLVTE